MKHNFEERKQNRIDHAKEQAEKNKDKADQLYNEAQKMSSVIPFGQPILLGHHSEKSDRSYRNKIHNKFGKSFEASDKAGYYEDKAATIVNNDAIFSDDPNALDKLKDKLAGLQTTQEFMKAANKCIKKKDKTAFLQLEYGTEKLWEQLNIYDSFDGTGFPSYRLRNNNANIARLKKRIEQVEKAATKTTQEIVINNVRIVENIEANRVQLFFPAIPPEEFRKQLKQNGFRWWRSESAWQRHHNAYALYLAKQLAGKYL